MMNSERLLEQRICALFQKDAPGPAVLAGVSGGADSVCLLHLLYALRKRFGYDLVCAHVNHGIRGAAADADEAFVGELCKKWEIPFFAEHVSVPQLARERKMGEEETGRQIRYEFFARIAAQMEQPCTVMTAHNANDRLETFFLNLIRGAGVKGLAGMKIREGNLYRPLLTTSRQEIEAYCLAQSLPFRQDETNEDDRYNRNWIRHQIVSPLTEKYPHILTSSARAMDHLAQAEQDVEKLAEELVPENGDITEKLLSAPTTVRHRTLQKFGEKAALHFDHKKVMLIDTVLTKGAGKVSVGGGWEITVSGGRIWLEKTKKTDPYSVGIDRIPGEYFVPGRRLRAEKTGNVYDLSKHIVLDCDKIKGSLTVRNRRESDSIQLPGRPEKRLKKLFAEAHIPPFLRDNVLLLSDDEGLIYAEGFGIAQRAAVTDGTKNALLITVEEES